MFKRRGKRDIEVNFLHLTLLLGGVGVLVRHGFRDSQFNTIVGIVVLGCAICFFGRTPIFRWPPFLLFATLLGYSVYRGVFVGFESRFVPFFLGGVYGVWVLSSAARFVGCPVERDGVV